MYLISGNFGANLYIYLVHILDSANTLPQSDWKTNSKSYKSTTTGTTQAIYINYNYKLQSHHTQQQQL